MSKGLRDMLVAHKGDIYILQHTLSLGLTSNPSHNTVQTGVFASAIPEVVQNRQVCI